MIGYLYYIYLSIYVSIYISIKHFRYNLKVPLEIRGLCFISVKPSFRVEKRVKFISKNNIIISIFQEKYDIKRYKNRKKNSNSRR